MTHTNSPDGDTGTAGDEDPGHHLTFEDTVRLDTTKEALWETISDPEVLTECVPGADDVVRVSKRKYTCEITRGISRLTVSLSGEIEFVEMNEPDWIVASGTAYDPKTGSEFDVLAAMEMTECEGGTVALAYSAEVSYTGGIASLGKTVLRPIVRSDINTYFENIRAVTEGER